MAYAILGNAEDAEDAVQTTFARLWEMRDKLEKMENDQGYFMTSLRNVCLNMLRERRYETDIDEEQPLNLEDPGISPQGKIEQRETRSLLNRLFSRLTPRTKRIVKLRHIGEYSIRDMAEITGESEANLRAILSRTRRQLREDFERENRKQ